MALKSVAPILKFSLVSWDQRLEICDENKLFSTRVLGAKSPDLSLAKFTSSTFAKLSSHAGGLYHFAACLISSPLLLNVTTFFLQLASAKAPLQAKIEDMEDAMQHLQDKFDKVKAENERVRYSFSFCVHNNLQKKYLLYQRKQSVTSGTQQAVWCHMQIYTCRLEKSFKFNIM